MHANILHPHQYTHRTNILTKYSLRGWIPQVIASFFFYSHENFLLPRQRFTLSFLLWQHFSHLTKKIFLHQWRQITQVEPLHSSLTTFIAYIVPKELLPNAPSMRLQCQLHPSCFHKLSLKKRSQKESRPESCFYLQRYALNHAAKKIHVY